MSSTDSNCPYDCDSLPSYTKASGLPSYDEALRYFEVSKSQGRSTKSVPKLVSTPSRISLLACIHTVATEKT